MSSMNKRNSFNAFFENNTVMVRQTNSAKNRPFTIKIVLPFDEKIEITDVVTSMNILAVKNRIELAIGIPR